MSDLQIALTVAGALVIACVIVYNRIQEGRFRRRADASLGADREIGRASCRERV